MNVFHILWRNVMHRKVLSLLTILSITLTTGLLVILLQASDGVEQSAEKGYGPFELTVGAKGSQTQLVLNTYYRVGSPIGNIPLQVLQDLKQEPEAAHVYAMTAGDAYNRYPIVGIEPDYFLTRYGDQRLQAGNMYARTGETIVGAHVAKMLDLKVGDTFHGSHGLVHEGGKSFDTNSGTNVNSTTKDQEQEQGIHPDEHHEDNTHVEESSDLSETHLDQATANRNAQEHHDDHEHFEYKIVGILPSLGTADDRAVFTTVDYAWHVHGITHDEDKTITAILVQPKSLLGTQFIKNKYDKRVDVQAAYTSKSVADVVNVVDQGTELVSFVSMICVVLAAISLLLSLTSVVTERKKDVGLMRLVGKSRRYVWSVLIGEGMLLTCVGLVFGLLLGHLVTYLCASSILEWTGVHVNAARIVSGEGWLLLGTLLIGFIASIGPAWKVYRVDPLQLFKN
ncbi:ABC transporter permease [Paenibacillus sp. UMB4589-SE434]|uniref:ABC transporter permease n=1 Tax=Paenibacillus sp. UMB4589-SE434 TaxID=3046314 RepID=UPI00254A4316|nr:ABC transporter permease [Paenibacillus sp. UMB4589-SE434]MDK8183024.1 ABC transporter permease [Paenibacillus sp. UMB4589-SE434]